MVEWFGRFSMVLGETGGCVLIRLFASGGEKRVLQRGEEVEPSLSLWD